MGTAGAVEHQKDLRRQRIGQPHPNDDNAMRRYVQWYEYDAVGNILAMIHRDGINLDRPGAPLWNRFYTYQLTYWWWLYLAV